MLRVKDDTVKKLVAFLMDNAESSLETAALLYVISDDETVNDRLKLRGVYETNRDEGRRADSGF